jgi:hypothetical protein
MRASFEEPLLPKRRFFAGGPTSPQAQRTTAFMTVAFVSGPARLTALAMRRTRVSALTSPRGILSLRCADT